VTACEAHTPAAASTSPAAPPRTIAGLAPGPGSAERAQRALTAIVSSGVLNACWQTVITQQPTHAPEAATVTVSVDISGRFTAIDVDRVCDPVLRSCFEEGLARVTIEPGETVNAQATFNLTVEGDTRPRHACTTEDRSGP
jgi:hypothetical protein